MQLIALLFIWPFLFLAFGLVFVAMDDLFAGSGLLWLFLALVSVFIILVREKSKPQQADHLTQLKVLRQTVVVFSISVLVPVFLRYLFDAFDHTLGVILVGLVVGFGLMIWGLFLKSHKVLMYSNLFGGALSVLYVYSQLWELGSGARVIAAAFGLIVAVVISVIKLKDKLT